MNKKQQSNKQRATLAALILALTLLYSGCGMSAPKDLTITMGEKTADVSSRYKATDDDFYLKLGNIIWIDYNEDGQVDGISISGRSEDYTLAGLSYGQDFSEPPTSLYDGNFQFQKIQEGNGMTYALYTGNDDSEYSNHTVRVQFTNHVISISMSDDSITEEELAAADATPVPTPTPVPTSTTETVYNPYPYYFPDDEDDEDTYDSEAAEYDEDAYMIPDSDTRKLTKADIKGMTSSELRIARNEIYARHGRMFQDAELQTYFDLQDWYVGTIAPEDFIDSEQLSKLERRNANFIKKYE